MRIEITTISEWKNWGLKTRLKRWIPFLWKSMPALSWGPLFIEWDKN